VKRDFRQAETQLMDWKTDLVDAFILVFAFSLANLRASIFIFLFPDTSGLLSPAWIEIALWLVLILAVLYKLIQANQLSSYLLMIRRNWLVVVFMLLTMVSVFWSIDRVVTLFRAIELLLATLIGVYLGMRYRPRQLLELLFWFGAILLILSITMVFAAPRTGTMFWPPFNGAWRGIYWHRNHLSSVAALLSVVFLCRAMIGFEKKDARAILDAIFGVLAVFVLIRTESATGYILFILLNSLVVCIWIWLKIRDRLRPWHYYLVLIVSIAGSVMILLNLDIVFGLFNRSSSMTGRVPLWISLINAEVSQRLWWGHGFGAVWTQDSFREEVRLLIGWASQPLIADNGFLDILLHLGVVGLLLFVSILVIAAVRSIQHALSHKTLADFFPLLFMVFALIANIPFSLFAETEVFVWMLIVMVIVVTSPTFVPLQENSQQNRVVSESART